jgi:RNA polymerase sigma-70 factor, ECF subfamily
VGIPVDYTNLDDTALIRLVMHARVGALEELYQRYNRLVFSVAMHVVGDRATAEEVTIDVFMRVWDKAALYRADQARVSTWLTSIARNRSIDTLRRRSSGSRLPELSIEEQPGLTFTGNPHGDPVDAAELADLQARMRAAISTLPAEQQEALLLSFFRGYTHSQIAEGLGIPLGTAKTRIRLAMQKLRQLLQDDGEP